MDFRAEAHKILIKVLIKEYFSDKLLIQVKKKYAKDTQNHELLYNLVKGVIKYYKKLDYIALTFSDKEKYKNTDFKIKILLYSGLFQIIYLDSIPDHAAVFETVELAKKLFNLNVSKYINAVLRHYMSETNITYPQNVIDKFSYKFSFPREIIEKWISLWGVEKTEILCNYFNKNALLNLRVNTFATNTAKLSEYFKRRKIKVFPSEASKNILVSDMAKEIFKDVAFGEGYFSIQDPAAAMVVEFSDPQINDTILDLFAAPGGKATYSAELIRDTGEIFAVEKSPTRAKMIKQNIERLRLKSIKVFTEDAFNFGPVTPSFDKVILDVPCSGWGIFQKKAELRWQAHQNIASLIKLQGKALKKGSEFVKDGGYLIYSTCTMNPEENEVQVNRFLEKHKNFTLVDAGETMDNSYVENGFLKILPFKHNIDGAFAAKMIKNTI